VARPIGAGCSHVFLGTPIRHRATTLCVTS
jgi:hypothetical protein